MQFSLALLPLIVAASAAATPAQVYGGGFDKVSKWYGTASGDTFGRVVAGVQDLNGDGVGEIAVGAPSHSPGGVSKAGLLEVRSGFDGSLLYQYLGTSANERVGRSVDSLGDVDGDLVSDFAVSALGGPNGPHWGQVTIYSGASGVAILTAPAPPGAQSFGDAVVGVGDVNSDAIPDVAVGASNSDTAGLMRNGAVFLISGADGSVIRSMEGSQAFIYLGSSVATPGDVDGDGVNDVLGGALWAAPGGVFRAGSAFLWSGATGAQIYRFNGVQTEQEFGRSVGDVGDADGDGVPDMAVGSTADFEGPGVREGSVTVYSGATGVRIYKYFGKRSNEEVGSSVSGAGDVDQDGLDDIVVGASGPRYGGRVYLVNALGQRLHTFESEGPTDGFGSWVDGVGDSDGDGDLDILVGAPAAVNGGVDGGGAYWYSFEAFLEASATSVSAAAGGSIVYDMDFPVDFLVAPPNLFYAMLVSGQGTGPHVFGGWYIPLTVDFLFLRTKNGQYPPQLTGGSGALDANGDASATLTFAPGQASGLIGSTFYVAAVSYETAAGTSEIRGVSRAVPLDIMP